MRAGAGSDTAIFTALQRPAHQADDGLDKFVTRARDDDRLPGEKPPGVRA
jgi:hypothetical protein